MTKNRKLVPPDGGWGWVIVGAYALNHLILVPIMQSFGLVFKDTFAELGFSATDGSIIFNTNAAASMLTGLFNGPLLKKFGYRKVSFAGAFFTTTGVILTGYADSFWSFFVTYGFVTALGMGMGMSSYPLALNSYFIKRRSKAAGITMTITGLGPVLMPQLLSLLMNFYDVRGTMLIIGAVAAHSFVAAALLQPVKWHMIDEVLDEENGNENIKKDDTTFTLLDNTEKQGIALYDKKDPIMQSMISIDHDLEVQAIYGIDTPLGGSVLSLTPGVKNRKYSISSYKSAHDLPINGKWHSTVSMDKTEHRNGDIRALSEPKYNEKSSEKPYNPDMTVKKDEKEKKKVGCFSRMLKGIVNAFDLTLLKDPIYVNIMLGMSLAVFAELNFSLLTPFIMADFNLTTPQIAMFLSVLSTADILFRFLAPFIGDFLNRPARIMYMFSLLLLISTRFTLLLFSEYYHLLGVAVLLGIAKGIRTVYWTLVIPNYVPIERLANASGLQMVVNGLFILAGGPVLGIIRDVTGSYKRCIYVINIVTFTTVMMWTVELLYLRYKSRQKAKAGVGT